MSITGSGPDDPQKVGTPIADLLAGMYGAYGVLAAVLERGRTGTGSVVRTSLLSAVVGVHAFQSTRWTVAGEVGRAQGNHHASIAPTGCSTARTGPCRSQSGARGCGAGSVQIRPRPHRTGPGDERAPRRRS
jgi:crotonobetainyl-CoA:carnitine CoA-transferase CaiB-like acyl-CoA transferase